MAPRCDGSASMQRWIKHADIISFLSGKRSDEDSMAAELALHLAHKPAGPVFPYLMNNIWPSFCP